VDIYKHKDLSIQDLRIIQQIDPTLLECRHKSKSKFILFFFIVFIIISIMKYKPL